MRTQAKWLIDVKGDVISRQFFTLMKKETITGRRSLTGITDDIWKLMEIYMNTCLLVRYSKNTRIHKFPNRKERS